VHPYYSNTRCTIYLDDARSVLPTLVKESVDLVATDPPYGKNFQSNTRSVSFDKIQGDASRAEATDLLTSCTPHVVLALRRSRHAYSFGLPLVHELLNIKAELAWDKGLLGSGDLSSPWSQSHEKIFFHVRSADRAKANLEGGKLAARLRKGSIISVKRPNANGVKRHPTEKPVFLMSQLIESSTALGDLVLDPFAGSGSTLVAAIVTGRRGIGIECIEKYAEIAAQRCERAEAVFREMESL
jgi:DNA modification methylase